jgi:hypothetical protein
VSPVSKSSKRQSMSKQNLDRKKSSVIRNLENACHVEFFRVGPQLTLKLAYQRTSVESLMISSPEQFGQNPHQSAKL